MTLPPDRIPDIQFSLESFTPDAQEYVRNKILCAVRDRIHGCGYWCSFTNNSLHVLKGEQWAIQQLPSQYDIYSQMIEGVKDALGTIPSPSAEEQFPECPAFSDNDADAYLAMAGRKGSSKILQWIFGKAKSRERAKQSLRVIYDLALQSHKYAQFVIRMSEWLQSNPIQNKLQLLAQETPQIEADPLKRLKEVRFIFLPYHTPPVALLVKEGESSWNLLRVSSKGHELTVEVSKNEEGRILTKIEPDPGLDQREHELMGLKMQWEGNKHDGARSGWRIRPAESNRLFVDQLQITSGKALAVWKESRDS